MRRVSPEAVRSWSPRRAALTVFAALLLVYVPSATWDYAINVDAAMAALPAWNLVENGTLDLRAHEEVVEQRADRSIGAVRTDDGRLVSNRTIGVIAWGVPFYALASPWVDPTAPFPMGPAAVAGAVATAAAMAVLHLVLRKVLDPVQALVGAMVAGLGTGAWSVAADGLWPHGPSMLWLALAILGLANGRRVWAGVGFGAALLVRPYNALAAAIAGVWTAVRSRSPRALLAVGVPAAAGLAVLLTANLFLYGQANVTGGYTEHPSVASAADLGSRTLASVGRTLVGVLLDPERGLVWYSPFLVVLALGLRTAWRVADDWVRAAAGGAVGAFAIQFWVQQSQGGSFFFSYRYPLDALMLAAPLLALAWREAVVVSPRRQQVFRVAVVLAVSLQVLGAVFEPYKG